jgi:hypothetical protein
MGMPFLLRRKRPGRPLFAAERTFIPEPVSAKPVPATEKTRHAASVGRRNAGRRDDRSASTGRWFPVILKLDKLLIELPLPDEPDPDGAAAVQELLGGRPAIPEVTETS